MHCDLAPASGQVALQDTPDNHSILLPYLRGRSPEHDVVLQHGSEQQRRLHLGGAPEQAFLFVGNEIVEDLFEGLRVAVGVEGESRQGDERLTQEPGVHPGEAGGDALAAVMIADEQVGPACEQVAVVGYGGSLGHHRIEAALERGRVLFLERSGKHDRFSRLHRPFEISRHEKIFPAVESAAVFVGIGHAVIPLGIVVVQHAGVRGLEHQVREAAVHAELGPVPYRRVTLVGAVIAVGECMDVAEGEERFQAHGRLGRALEQFILDEELVFVRMQQQGLAENDVSDLVGDRRDGIRTEIHHVLVPPGLVDVAIAMYAEVELLAVHDEGFVDCGEQQILVSSEAVQRDGQQPVIATGIAGDYAGVAVGTRLVYTDDLPLE